MDACWGREVVDLCPPACWVPLVLTMEGKGIGRDPSGLGVFLGPQE